MIESVLPQGLDVCIKEPEFKNFSYYRLDNKLEKWIKYALHNPNRHFRKNLPFNGKQAAFILSKYKDLRASKRFKEPSERNTTKRNHIKFRISFHS